ncbi:MAG: helix-turn-helix domain containing protein [Azovibrio sp.]|nr:helix-turn-helix domain containing protein [Azovibrio sp.]
MSDSHVRFAHDSGTESDTLSRRLRACIGDEPVAAFARRCGMPEATIRSYLEGKKPVYDKLARIADAAGVSLEWLATGRGPMRREAPPQAAFEVVPYGRRLEKIGLLLAGMDEKEAAALLDELYARAQTAAEAAELRRALGELRAEVERLKKRA